MYFSFGVPLLSLFNKSGQLTVCCDFQCTYQLCQWVSFKAGQLPVTLALLLPEGEPILSDWITDISPPFAKKAEKEKREIFMDSQSIQITSYIYKANKKVSSSKIMRLLGNIPSNKFITPTCLAFLGPRCDTLFWEYLRLPSVTLTKNSFFFI